MYSDAGIPVYMYEFVYSADIHKSNRPSFVKADHADDVGFVFGACFWSGHIQITGGLDILCHHKHLRVEVILISGNGGINQEINVTTKVKDVPFSGIITAEDERLCRTMMSYWGSFTRTG